MQRLGRKKLLNPIAQHLNEVMDRLSLSKEQICVSCGLRYFTLDNVWKRRNVSYTTLKSLKLGGLIPDKVEQDYHVFIKAHPPTPTRKQRMKL